MVSGSIYRLIVDDLYYNSSHCKSPKTKLNNIHIYTTYNDNKIDTHIYYNVCKQTIYDNTLYYHITEPNKLNTIYYNYKLMKQSKHKLHIEIRLYFIQPKYVVSNID